MRGLGLAHRRDEAEAYVSDPPGLPAEIETAIEAFAAGIEGVRPSDAVVKAARGVSLAAVQRTREPEISVDIDGELSFDLRLADGRLVLAELSPDGRVHLGIHDASDQLEEHRTTDCQTLLSVIKS